MNLVSIQHCFKHSTWMVQILLENLTYVSWVKEMPFFSRRFVLYIVVTGSGISPIILWEWYYPGFHCVITGTSCQWATVVLQSTSPTQLFVCVGAKQLLLIKSDFFSEWPCTEANADIRDVSKFWPNFFMRQWWEKHTWFVRRLTMTSDIF